MRKLPRGVRNNNPGNIDFNRANNWLGQLGIEQGVPNPRFARFDIPEHGIRAIIKILQSYRRRGIKTPRGIAYTWAPPHENNTVAYARVLANALAVGLDEEIRWTELNAGLLAREIVRHENGYDPYPAAIYDAAVKMGYSL